MTPRQTLEVRRSEIRSRLGEVAALNGDELTDAIQTERDALLSELTATEPQLRAAIAAEPDPDEQITDPGENRELRALIQRGNLGAAMRDTLTRGALTGAEAELAAARECGGKIPFDLIERRAAATIPASGSGQAVESHEILPQIFETPVSAFVGCERPRVMSGTHAYPIIGTGATVETPAQGTAVTESSPTITAKTITPSRVTAQIRFQVEDAATLPMMETALQENIRAGIADALEKQCVAKLFSTATDAAPTAETNALTYAIWLAKVSGAIDGVHAASVADIRQLVGVDSIKKLETSYYSESADPFTAADFSRVRTAGIMATVHAPAAASSAQEVLVVRGMHPGSLVQPVWEGFEIIRDRYTDAGSGEVLLTGIVLQGVDVPRSAVFSRESIKVS